MILDPGTNKKRQAARRRQVRTMMRFENVFERRIVRSLNKQYSNVAFDVSHGRMVVSGVDKELGSMRKMFRENYKIIVASFGQTVFNILAIEKGVLRIPQTKGMEETFWAEMNAWLSTYAAKRIKDDISPVTKNRIRRILQESVDAGMTPKDIAKRIREEGKITNKYRARMIARTETHTAAVKAIDKAVEKTGLKMKKVWVSALDERTRTSPYNHLRANNETVPQDKMFKKTGQRIRYPGDPDGAPGNIINCRCVVVYRRDRGKRRKAT